MGIYGGSERLRPESFTLGTSMHGMRLLILHTQYSSFPRLPLTIVSLTRDCSDQGHDAMRTDIKSLVLPSLLQQYTATEAALGYIM
jgi:hypothetical protein